MAGNAEDFNVWFGWVNSRVRKELILLLEYMTRLRLSPKKHIPPRSPGDPYKANLYIGLYPKVRTLKAGRTASPLFFSNFSSASVKCI